MDLVYSLLDNLPLELLSYSFMKNAFLAILLVTPLFGLLSTMVVSNRMAFFADSLGHGAFSGIAIGVLLGSNSPLFSLIVFSVIFAVFITYIKQRSQESTDTIISVFSAMAVAVGLMIMSRGGGFNKFSSYLIGDVLSIRQEEVAALFAVFCLVLIAWSALFNSLLLISINAAFARSRGIKSFFIESCFASLVAVVVAVSIQWVGILVINSLLVLPGAAARNVTSDVKGYHLVSVLLSVLSGLTGLVAAYYCDMAVGATVVLIAAVCYFVTLVLKPYFVR